jgi:class 3 adenylate cyclase/predicted ATPase
MNCASCSADNVEGAKFCVECGAPQRPAACAGCGSPLGRGRFCAECGTPVPGAIAVAGPPSLSAPPEAVPARTAERRRTSVLFGDLVGFTTLSESRDPEEVRELLSRYFDKARTVVQRYGGTVEKFIGDAVMAVWGVPVAHEDDAERAVRAGLDLVGMVAALGEDVGVTGLALRVGVVTGEVAVTLGATGEGMVAGDAVNTAARVQTAAQPGTVWVDDATRMLTSAAVTYTDTGEHELKGKAEPLRLFQARAVVAAVGGAQRVDGLEAPFTGRDRELRLVKELFHATSEDGRPRLVTVSGVAGVGKTRLGWEFEKYIDGLTILTRWHRGRCLSYGEGVAFWAFAEMVRSRLELIEPDAAGHPDRKVAETLQRWVPDADERAWIAPRLDVLLGHGEGSTFDRADLFAAWTVFLERVGEGGPMTLLFEDLHYADSGLLDLIDHLLETARFPLFVLAFTRPELLERRPSLVSGRRTTPVYLEPLNDPAMTALVDGLVAGLPATARAALVAKAEGVPLYAVETVRSLIDRDAVVPLEGRYVFVDSAGDLVDLATLAAPASLQTLIAARLDALSPAERRAVQDASVLGLSFSREGLVALSGDTAAVDDLLTSLQRKEILELQSDPRSPERGQYRFLQALVRQVAYDTMSRRDRKSRHLAAVAHLALVFDDAGDLAAVLAQHYLDALDASSTDDRDHDELALQARTLLRRAAVRAAALGSPDQALLHAETALSRGAVGLELHELEELAASNAREAGNAERALELARSAKAGYQAEGHQLAAVRALIIEGESLRDQSRLQQVVDLLEPAYEQMKDDAALMPELFRVAAVLSAAHLFLGSQGPAQAYGLLALTLAEEHGDAVDIANALYRVSTILLYMGSPTASRAVLHESIRVSREHGLPRTLGMALSNLASLTYPRDLQSGLEFAAEALAVSEQVGDRSSAAVVRINLVLADWLLGGWSRIDEMVAGWRADGMSGAAYAGLEFLLATIAWSRGEPVPEPTGYDDDLGDAYDRASLQEIRALRLAQAGDTAAAAALADAAMRDYHASYGYEDDLVLFWSNAVELALLAGDTDRVHSMLALAAVAPRVTRTALLEAHEALYQGQLVQQESGDPEPLLRTAIERLTAYGARFRRAQAQLALGAWLSAQGRSDEAAPLLADADEMFTEVGAQPGLAAVAAARDRVGA